MKIMVLSPLEPWVLLKCSNVDKRLSDEDIVLPAAPMSASRLNHSTLELALRWTHRTYLAPISFVVQHNTLPKVTYVIKKIKMRGKISDSRESSLLERGHF